MMIKLAKTVPEYDNLEKQPYQKLVALVSCSQSIYSNFDSGRTYFFESSDGGIYYYIKGNKSSKEEFYKQ